MLEALSARDLSFRGRTDRIEDFSLVRVGPIYKLEQALRLTAAAGKHCRTGVLIAATISWLPLFVLALVEGTLTGGQVKIPFLFDFWTNVRFLVTLPLLIIAESLIDTQTRHAVKRFVDAGLVTDEVLPVFEALLRKVVRLCNSPVAGLLLIVLAIGGPIWANQTKLVTKELSSWQFKTVGQHLTPAGWWLMLVSNPLYRLLLIRWVWVLAVWSLFLHRVVRLPLRFAPSHPDKAAGVGFLGHTQLFFGILTFALSAAVAGGFANLLTYERSSILTLKFGIIGFWVAAVAISGLPLLFLAPRLFQIKQQGLNDYSILACEYTRRFDRKWLRPVRRENEELLGTPDIQSLSDLNQCYSVVRDLNFFMIDRRIFVGLAIPPLIPMLVLVISTVPLDALTKSLLRLLA